VAVPSAVAQLTVTEQGVAADRVTVKLAVVVPKSPSAIVTSLIDRDESRR
jgi:hypothetical protein